MNNTTKRLERGIVPSGNPITSQLTHAKKISSGSNHALNQSSIALAKLERKREQSRNSWRRKRAREDQLLIHLANEQVRLSSANPDLSRKNMSLRKVVIHFRQLAHELKARRLEEVNSNAASPLESKVWLFPNYRYSNPSLNPNFLATQANNSGPHSNFAMTANSSGNSYFTKSETEASMSEFPRVDSTFKQDTETLPSSLVNKLDEAATKKFNQISRIKEGILLLQRCYSNKNPFTNVRRSTPVLMDAKKSASFLSVYPENSDSSCFKPWPFVSKANSYSIGSSMSGGALGSQTPFINCLSSAEEEAISAFLKLKSEK